MLFYYAAIIRIENVGDLFCCRSTSSFKTVDDKESV